MNALRARWRWSHWLPWLGGALLLALVLAAAVLWWFHTHTRIERTIDLPPQGEAAYNPLYLLREALRADGINAQSRPRLQLERTPLGTRDTVVVFGDPRLLGDEDVAQLLAWVSRGGHLLVRLPAYGARSRQRRAGVLLESLDIRLSSAPARFCFDAQMPGDLPELTFCAREGFMFDHDAPDVAWGDPVNGYALARRPWGRGSVDVLAQLDFLTNTQLDSPQRAVLARQLLAPNYGQGTVHLIYGAQMPPLWRLMLEHGRMVWLPLLLALGAWLWLRMPRFGPLRPTPSPARRALLEHVEASGEHLYRYGRAAVLHAAMREAFRARLRRCDPLAATLESDTQCAAIAARTGLPVAEVAEALGDGPTHAAGFRRKMAVLVQMMRRLGASGKPA